MISIILACTFMVVPTQGKSGGYQVYGTDTPVVATGLPGGGTMISSPVPSQFPVAGQPTRGMFPVVQPRGTGTLYIPGQLNLQHPYPTYEEP